jgi:hypothetical protein
MVLNQETQSGNIELRTTKGQFQSGYGLLLAFGAAAAFIAAHPFLFNVAVALTFN